MSQRQQVVWLQDGISLPYQISIGELRHLVSTQIQYNTEIAIYGLHISFGHNSKFTADYALFYSSYDTGHHRWKEQASTFPIPDVMVTY